jgi:hypothetical protein
MSDEFKFTENSAKSVVKSELVSAETKAIIDEGKAAGKSAREVGKAVFAKMSQEEIESLSKTIRLINLLVQMGHAFEMGEIEQQNNWVNGDRRSLRLTNHALFGYLAICQHYVDSEPAKKWQRFFDEAQTIGDVYAYFLQENNLTYDEASGLVGYMILDVEEILKIRLDQQGVVNFAINKELWDAAEEKDRKSLKAAENYDFDKLHDQGENHE